MTYYSEHREEMLERQKEYQNRHKDEIKLRQRTWRMKNIERVREIEKESKEKHKERCKEYAKRYGRKLKFAVLSHYSGNPPKCYCCGETEIQFLTIDHIKGSGHKHRSEINRFGYNFYIWLRRNHYPEGYQVACYNCNCAKKGNNGVCPHEK